MSRGSFYSSTLLYLSAIAIGAVRSSSWPILTFIVNSFSHCGGENEKEEEECIEGEKDQFIENESQQNRGDEK